MSYQSFSEKVVLKTEQFLTWRKRRKLHLKEKQARKNPVLDWVEVILSAIVIVLLINQFLFQAYQIPSASMVPTIEEGDRIFVNKFIYGPELIPGQYKLDSKTKPLRGEIIIFESPNYISRGPIFEIWFRVVFMLSFTFINLDVDERGAPEKHFLIKRAIGVPGDRIRTTWGNVEIMRPESSQWISEKTFKETAKLKYPEALRTTYFGYDTLEKSAVSNARDINAIFASKDAVTSMNTSGFQGNYYYDEILSQEDYKINPHHVEKSFEWRKMTYGWYITKNYIFPMGDNRDNSKDARSFGPVSLRRVLGRASFRFFPFGRFGLLDKSNR